jgi:hypothetical protein
VPVTGQDGYEHLDRFVARVGHSDQVNDWDAGAKIYTIGLPLG